MLYGLHIYFNIVMYTPNIILKLKIHKYQLSLPFLFFLLPVPSQVLSVRPKIRAFVPRRKNRATQ